MTTLLDGPRHDTDRQSTICAGGSICPPLNAFREDGDALGWALLAVKGGDLLRAMRLVEDAERLLVAKADALADYRRQLERRWRESLPVNEAPF